MLARTLLLLAILNTCTGCSALYLYETSSAGRYATEPASPRDGYRIRKPDGTVLQYDAKRELYFVVDRPEYYYHKGSYYRQTRGQWQTSVTVSGNWRVVSADRLPRGLRL